MSHMSDVPMKRKSGPSGKSGYTKSNAARKCKQILARAEKAARAARATRMLLFKKLIFGMGRPGWGFCAPETRAGLSGKGEPKGL